MDENIQQIALSVIVPCYNVEPYLDRTFRCLERQWDGRTDYEIILINDASTDGTIDKLYAFQQRYPDNVVIIDKKVNAGAAESRNSGLDVARGQWIVFFDPDDALVDNGYAQLLDLTRGKDYDILSFEVEIVHDYEWKDSFTTTPTLITIEWEGSAREYMLQNHYGTSIKFFFKRELLCGRRFKPLSFLEDLVFVLPIFLSDAKVGLTNAKAYFYILRSSSATNMIDSKRLNRGCDDILTAIQFMDECKQGHSDAIKARIGERQQFYRLNLITRLLLSNKNLNEIKRHHAALDQLTVPKDALTGKKIMIYNYLFDHPRMMLMLRPLYRLVRLVHSWFLH
ncbi:MAG: glycosyltransferase family 2 protein [Muribaculaceae bacterium]|nr:glycosyltransferase family 2 protein [Muribaculaceae bacterium]